MLGWCKKLLVVHAVDIELEQVTRTADDIVECSESGCTMGLLLLYSELVLSLIRKPDQRLPVPHSARCFCDRTCRYSTLWRFVAPVVAVVVAEVMGWVLVEVIAVLGRVNRAPKDIASAIQDLRFRLLALYRYRLR